MCPKCGKVVSFHGWYPHLKIHLREEGVTEEQAGQKLWYKCDKCPEQFPHPGTLKYHKKKVHDGIKMTTKLTPSTCAECGATFKGRQHLSHHMNMYHIKDGKYQCKICGKPNGTKGALKLHMVKHEEPKFKCSDCGKMFKFKSNLEAHEREHRGEKPFACSICPASFSAKFGLDQHVKGVHKIAGPRGGATGWGKFGKNKSNQ